MGYTNSPLVAYTKLSPNNSGQRTHCIDRITPHCVVGQCTAEGLGDWFAKASTQASSNYGIDKDGRVGLYVEEKNRSWCSSSSANDQRAVTIECASDTAEPYAFRDVVYQTLIKLCADICRRNGKKKLLWLADKDKTLAYEPAAEEMVLTVHRWFANKSCPGNWMYARMGDLAAKVTAVLSGVVETPAKTEGTQANTFASLSEGDVIKKVGGLFTADQQKSGILASVSLAQFILESGYGKSELARNANNVFGMKKSLSGNTWTGSAWDGESVYTKKTKEQNEDGSYTTITADFRKYPCVEDSIADHSAYLLGAKNGSKLRYDGLKDCTDYKTAAQIIKDGGYATSLTYVEKLCSIIERWNLTQYDMKAASTTEKPSNACSADKVIAVAVAEIGYKEKKSNSQLDDKAANAGSGNYTKYARDFDQKYPKWYNGKKNGYAWCDMFVDWCFLTAYGYENALRLLCQPEKSAGAGCTYSLRYYKSKGQFHTSGPKPGDQIFFGTSLDNSTHTGIVEKVTAQKVFTIEGNTSDQVARRNYALTNSRILGYGRPAYGSAAETAPAPTPKTPVPESGTSVPFLVKVSIPDLNIRKGPGTGYARTGQFTGAGVFTIVAVSGNWGKLKSGAGWISLAYATRL